MLPPFKDHPVVQNMCDAGGVSAILDAMFDAAKAVGGDKFSYHFTPIFGSPTSAESVVYSQGFPAHWVALYEDREVRDADPIPDTIFRAGRLMTWGEAIYESELNEAEKRFVFAMQNNGLHFGFGVALWGPANRNAYASVGFPEPVRIRSDCALLTAQMLLQCGHQKICERIPMGDDIPKLSVRESEILTWAARGKSNNDIATILNLSAETVSTYLSRAFAKLNSRDRIGASIKALKLGLIQI